MLERYIRHIFKEQYNIDVKSLVITSKHEYIADDNNNVVFYTAHFKFTDIVRAHDNCSITVKVDFHSYETNDEMYTTFLELSYN